MAHHKNMKCDILSLPKKGRKGYISVGKDDGHEKNENTIFGIFII